jgi:uncharacterized OB-fold protein
MTATHLPVAEYLKDGDGGPYLEGQACEKCQAIFLGERAHCGRCFARGSLKPKRLSNRGTLYVYSIVHRSFPGIAVPYVSAIVDLEGGGTVKGNLIGIEPDPAKIKLGMPVQVVYRDLERKDEKGNTYFSYFFQPA